MSRLDLREHLTDAPITAEYLDNFLYERLACEGLDENGEWFKSHSQDLALLESIAGQVLLHLYEEE